MNLTQKAEIAQVPFGNLSLEGLMTKGNEDGNGTFGIATPQICLKLDIPEKNSQRYLAELLQIPSLKKDSTTLVESSPSNGSQSLILKWKTTLHPKAVNIILLPDFEKLLAKLDRAGNKAAQNMRDDLVGMSMHQLFSNAFGIKFEKEDHQ